MELLGVKKICVPAKLEQLDRVMEFTADYLEQMGCSMKLSLQIQISIEELFANVVNYGYPDEPGEFRMIMEMTGDSSLIMTLEDEGVEFNPLLNEDPDITLSAEERKIGGLGIFMVKMSMDKTEYQREGDTNRLILTKSW